MKLISKIISTYKSNLLLSLTMSIVIIALRTEKNVTNILLIILGCLLSSLIMELEYFIQAYWNEPESSFSIGLRELVKQKNYVGVIAYIEVQKYSIERRIVHSVCFQVIAALLAFFLITTPNNAFSISVSISVFVQSLYQMYDEYNTRHTVDSWFWVLKSQPTKKTQAVYSLLMGLCLIALLAIGL